MDEVQRRCTHPAKEFVVKRLLGVLVLLLAACFGYAPTAWSQTNQQERQKGCAAEAQAKKLTGTARKSFIDDCLNRKEAAGPIPSPQEQFRSCSLKATDQKLSGDARKDFMANCRKREAPNQEVPSAHP
jgi:hypothetical protein